MNMRDLASYIKRHVNPIQNGDDTNC